MNKTIVVKTRPGMIWRKPWAPSRKVVDSPEAIQITNPSIEMYIRRAIGHGDLIETDEQPVAHDKRRLPLPRNPEEDLIANVLAKDPINLVNKA